MNVLGITLGDANEGKMVDLSFGTDVTGVGAVRGELVVESPVGTAVTGVRVVQMVSGLPQ